MRLRQVTCLLGVSIAIVLLSNTIIPPSTLPTAFHGDARRVAKTSQVPHLRQSVPGLSTSNSTNSFGVPESSPAQAQQRSGWSSSSTLVVVPNTPAGVSEYFQSKSTELLRDSSAALLRMLQDHEARTSTTTTSQAAIGFTSTTTSTASCVFAAGSPHGKRRRFDYSHRVKRKGEFSTMELYEQTKRIADGMVEFAPRVDTLINQYPLQLSPEFDLSEPFGSWSTRFFPVSASLHSSTAGKKQHRYHPPQKLEAQPPMYAALFSNAVVSHGHVVTCRGEVLTAGGCLWDFHLPHDVGTRAGAREPLVVALCDEWCKGYYHFTHEHLPRLAVVHQLLVERNDTKVMLSHAPNAFQRQFLHDVLGIPLHAVSHGAAVVANQVVYPTPMRCGNTFTGMLYLIRRIVYNRLDLGEGPTLGDGGGAATKLRFLFAERKHLSRMPTNYFDIKASLMKDFASEFDFVTTVGESNAKFQVELFHQADVVLGPHGANIANIMWMRHGTHVIEMASRRKGNMCYYATSSRINVTHHLVLHDKGKDAKYTLEYGYVQRHVEAAVRALRA